MIRHGMFLNYYGMIYSLGDPEADCCLVLAPGAGIVWVPTECLERIGTFSEATFLQFTDSRYRAHDVAR